MGCAAPMTVGGASKDPKGGLANAPPRGPPARSSASVLRANAWTVFDSMRVNGAERWAIEEAGAGDSVVVRFAPFFLDDTLPVEGVDRRSYYRQRFGEAAMAQVDEQMAGVFEREGIGHAYVSEGTACSSLPAHRLLAYAERHFPGDVGLAERVASELFLRYFSACARDRAVDAGENIASIEVLTSVAASAGIRDTAAVRAFLEGDALTHDVVAAAARNRARGGLGGDAFSKLFVA